MVHHGLIRSLPSYDLNGIEHKQIDPVLKQHFTGRRNERAKIAFRFMWGVGCNEPYPVANLYPFVGSGDDDWRSYYTVNLLNLPHHYHNGGFWPFIGAQWVRFVHRPALREVAIQELIKVARLNQLGVAAEWEFNEWAHGVTGRPMGKAYQAWSASEFILACNELNLGRI